MRVGMMGLGVMGEGIVLRLPAAGHTVTGWNRTKSRAEVLIQKGMKWMDSSREVAEQSDVVLSNVRIAHRVYLVSGGFVERESNSG